MSRVGEVLVHEGAVSSAGLRRALTFQRYGGQGLRLGTILVGWNLADEETLLRALARAHGCDAVSWSDLSRASSETTSLLPAEIAEQTRAIPFKKELRAIRVAFANPSDLAAVDRVSSVLRQRVIPAVALEIRILQAQALFYGTGIPPDHRPILFKLRESADKTAWESPSTSTGRAIPILAGPSDATGEPVRELPPFPVSLPPSPEETTRPIAMPSPVSDSEAAEGPEARSGLWLSGGDVPAGSTGLDPPTPQVSSESVYSGRPGREEVARAVLESLLREMPRTIVFGLDRDHIVGLSGRGPGISAEEIRRIHLPPADGSFLRRVWETHAPHIGTPAAEMWPAPLAMLLGLDPLECAVFPMEGLNGLVGLLYADRAGDRMREQDFIELNRAAAFLAGALGSPLRAH